MKQNKEAERWLPVMEFEGVYSVSNTGKIKSHERVVVRSSGRPYPVRERILKPAPDEHGYMRAALSGGEKLRTVKVHREVLKAFIPIDNHKEMTVNHINGIKDDNRLGNLEWMTHRDNILESFKTGQQDNFIKGAAANSRESRKFTPLQVANIRLDRIHGMGFRPLARKYGADRKTIKCIIDRKTYKDIE
jgi:hypothetical protein